MRSALRGFHWYLKQVTGEARWDEHLARSRAAGVDPLSRREFERRRAAHREENPQARCC